MFAYENCYKLCNVSVVGYKSIFTVQQTECIEHQQYKDFLRIQGMS